MKIEKLTENKIRVIVKPSDLDIKNLDIRSFMTKALKEQNFFTNMLKKAKEEQKICTLYVSDNARGLGIGSAIIEESMKWLGTTKPFITFPDYKLDMFKPFIEKYAWNLTEKVYGLYKDKTEELCFNGAFNKDKKDSSKHHKKLMKALNTKN